jgi:2-polyprenyl-3-methyl-5-hydroxy-6-metoxy-1,4-benzoquinol methylase
MNAQDISSLANNEAFCKELLKKSPLLNKICLEHAEGLLNAQIGGVEFCDPREVEVQVEKSALDILFKIIATQWKHCGDNYPHYSVLCSKRYQPSELDQSRLEEFYQTGRGGADAFIELCAKNGVHLKLGGSCLDFGCGVGRVTVHLAQRFSSVRGIDISPGNLREADVIISKMGIENASLMLLQDPSDLQEIDPVDAIYSMIVLQHNTPPIQYYLFSCLLNKLKENGVAMIQFVTAKKSYKFSVSEYLKSHAVQGFEMHALPIRHVLQVIRDQGCQLVSITRDMAGGGDVASYTLLIRRS